MRKRKFELYCTDPENIENYEKAKVDDFKDWQCHHRLETHNSDGERRLVDISRDELIALGMYWHRPSSELIFMTESEHGTLHNKGKPSFMKGKSRSEETRKKISEATKGEKNPFYGKIHSEVSRKKMSEAHKGKHFSEEHKRKMSETRKGKCKSKEWKKKMSEIMKGKSNPSKGSFWFNNGKINIRSKECPEGFVPGRISWKQ